jgi:hypothetical protein
MLLIKNPANCKEPLIVIIKRNNDTFKLASIHPIQFKYTKS